MIKTGRMGLEKCRLIRLPEVRDRRGRLVVLERGPKLPFKIERVFYVYGVPGGKGRGQHAHKKLEQMILAASGRFEVILDDGRRKKRFVLKDPRVGLYIPPLVWHELRAFSKDAVCLVLASRPYDEASCFRDYEKFLGFTRRY
jgi:dTDP-4-dehydrorhamnose 3,5-epimerase-like enzyme